MICGANISSGPNKGNVCGRPVKYLLDNGAFCGYHVPKGTRQPAPRSKRNRKKPSKELVVESVNDLRDVLGSIANMAEDGAEGFEHGRRWTLRRRGWEVSLKLVEVGTEPEGEELEREEGEDLEQTRLEHEEMELEELEHENFEHRSSPSLSDLSVPRSEEHPSSDQHTHQARPKAAIRRASRAQSTPRKSVSDNRRISESASISSRHGSARTPTHRLSSVRRLDQSARRQSGTYGGEDDHNTSLQGGIQSSQIRLAKPNQAQDRRGDNTGEQMSGAPQNSSSKASSTDNTTGVYATPKSYTSWAASHRTIFESSTPLTAAIPDNTRSSKGVSPQSDRFSGSKRAKIPRSTPLRRRMASGAGSEELGVEDSGERSARKARHNTLLQRMEACHRRLDAAKKMSEEALRKSEHLSRATEHKRVLSVPQPTGGAATLDTPHRARGDASGIED